MKTINITQSIQKKYAAKFHFNTKQEIQTFFNTIKKLGYTYKLPDY